MKLLIYVLITLVAAAYFSMTVSSDPGYIMLGYGDWTIESSFVFFSAVVLISFLIFYNIFRVLGVFVRIPKLYGSWRGRRRAAKAGTALSQGVMALTEGRWSTAEKLLTKYVDHSDAPMINYLNAARAAQKLGANGRRDRYLRKAGQSVSSKANIAIELTRAELQLSHQQAEQALATLTQLRRMAPKNSNVLRLLMNLYAKVGDWEGVLDVLPQLQKVLIVSTKEMHQLEATAYTQLLVRAGQSKDVEELQATWARVPKQLQASNDKVVVEYVRQLMACGADDVAETVVVYALQKNRSDALVYLYGQIHSSTPLKQLARAESWAISQKGEESPALLLTLGRICINCNFPDKAHQYFKDSLLAGEEPETYQELGNLLEKMGEEKVATDCFRKGLALSEHRAAPTTKELTADRDNKPAPPQVLLAAKA
ncbi:MAG: heme biosynthesis protein HemY [Gammaproteobacteria bacterium]|nr:heme biosynthesis protein HemY [Gammaproteobacteria bacterium]